jgi:DNA repair protein RecO (recombination protein O)
LRNIKSEALLVRAIAYGESDVIATLLTATDGKIAVMVRGARKSSKRVGGALEPFHTIEVSIDDRGGELGTLKEARILRVRAGIVGSLAALDAAGTALRWARHLCPPRIPEPAAWETMIALLDALDSPGVSPRIELSVAALQLLSAVGYALDLERCVSCAKACPVERPAWVDVARGGIVCTACGGARSRITPELRRLALQILAGENPKLTALEADDLLLLVDDAMAVHTGFQAG